MTVKASPLLCLIAIWAAVVMGIAFEPGAWWATFFALLASVAVGLSAMRRLGLSRIVAVAGAWAGAAVAFGADGGATWMSIFAFLTTTGVVYSRMKPGALLEGAAVAVAWLAAGVTANQDADAAWTGIFAALSAKWIAGGGRLRSMLGAAAWGAAGAVMTWQEGMYWLAPIAFFVTLFPIGKGVAFPRRFEWDLSWRTDDGDVIDGESRPLR
ncbi:MAG: hypothetical protein AB7T37_09555 [Dehalococcoidia bacterium]